MVSFGSNTGALLVDGNAWADDGDGCLLHWRLSLRHSGEEFGLISLPPLMMLENTSWAGAVEDSNSWSRMN